VSEKKKLILILGIIFLQFIIVARPSFASFRSYEEYKMEIRRLGDSGQYNEAIETTKEMLTYYPEDRTMWLPILSGYYIELRDLRSAADAQEEYLGSYPDDFTVKRLLAMNYLEQGLYDRSIPLIKDCLEYNPNDTIMRLEYSKALSEKGLYSDAETQSRIYIKSKPNDYKGWWMLGRIMSNKGNKVMATIYWLNIPMFRIRFLFFLALSSVLCLGLAVYYRILGRSYKKETISDVKTSAIWVIGIRALGLFLLSAAVYNFYHPLLEGHWWTYPVWFAQYVFPLFLLIVGIGLLMRSKWARTIVILFILSKVLEWVWNLSFSYGDISKISLSIAVLVALFIPILYLGLPKVTEQFK